MMASKILGSLCANIQMDCLATEGNEDFSWMRYGKAKPLSPIWMVVEMKILMPLCAFPMQKTNLGLNREIKRDVKNTLGIVNTKIGAVITQAGTLEGIENIKPPIRLLLFPMYPLNKMILQPIELLKGLDIKYGINDALL
jgi:hypothetical protein